MSAALRLHRADTQLPADVAGEFLARLDRRLHLPQPHRRQVLDELACHLDERVRDLMVTGVTEEQASRRAVDELGDPAVLARRFERAHRAPRRRRTMNMLMIGLASAAALTGALTLRTPQVTIRSAVYPPPDAAQTASQKTMDIQGLPQDVQWGDFFALAASVSGKTPVVHWGALRELDSDNFGPGHSLGIDQLTDQKLTLDQFLDLINTEKGFLSDNRIEYRDEEGRLIFATTHYFDRRETRLVTYDVSELVLARLGESTDDADLVQAAVQEVADLIRALVESNIWDVNGGQASITTYGTKLFVRVPQRFLPRIEWVLEQAADAHIGSRQGASMDQRPADFVRHVQTQTSRPTATSAGTLVSVQLQRVDPVAAREILDQVFNEVPSLKQCSVARWIDVDASSRTVSVSASQRHVEFVSRLLTMIDRPGTDAPASSQSSMQVVALARVSSQTMSSIISAITERSTWHGREFKMVADPRQNSVIVEGPAVVVASLQELIALLDTDWEEPAKVGAAVGH
ncbi:MAG: permease prefix domain 1-containing protein [Phycisphaerales bacterium]|nr:permease prefix domain 1-containing protein [Phycisphaerales bacterium]